MNNPNTTEKNAAMKMPWIELEDLCVPKQILGHRWEIVRYKCKFRRFLVSIKCCFELRFVNLHQDASGNST